MCFGPTGVRDFCFKIDNALGIFVSVRPVQQFQNCCDVIFVSGLLGREIRFEITIAWSNAVNDPDAPAPVVV